MLDLSNNALFEVVGLGTLRYLKDLDLTANPNLDLVKVLASLEGKGKHNGGQAVTTLVSVAMRPDVSVPATPEHRLEILRALALHNPRLAFLEGHMIPPNDRAVALTSLALDCKCPTNDAYAAEAAIIACFAPYKTRSFLPADMRLDTQTQFDPRKVATLRILRGMGLSSHQMLSLAVFSGLVMLDLSHNALTTVQGLGLQQLACLRGLDLSHNELKEGPEELAAVLNQLPELLMLAVRSNPGMDNKGNRIKLLSLLSSVVRMCLCYVCACPSHKYTTARPLPPRLSPCWMYRSPLRRR